MNSIFGPDFYVAGSRISLILLGFFYGALVAMVGAAVLQFGGFFKKIKGLGCYDSYGAWIFFNDYRGLGKIRAIERRRPRSVDLRAQNLRVQIF